MLKLTTEQQLKIAEHVSDTFETYSDLLSQYKTRLSDVYKAVTTYKERPKAKRQTTFKVNKAFEVENKVLPRIIANNPKWLVSVRTDEFTEGDAQLTPEERAIKYGETRTYAEAIRDYLTYVFNKYDLQEVTKLRVKSMVRYGIGWAKVCYKYDLDVEPYSGEVTEYDDEGNEVKTRRKKTKKKVVGQRPTIDVLSWSDIYFDPRHIRQEDFPALVEIKEGVRLSYFTRNADSYMNIDELVKIAGINYEDHDQKGYKEKIMAVSGISWNKPGKIDINNLTVKKYYGWYELPEDGDGSEEKMYEFWTIDDSLVVYAQEIYQLPYQAIKCFEDTETFLATGFLEPILGLQDELNFKKNSASHYINLSLNPPRVRSPNSGINPKHMSSSPGGIIPTTKDAETAITNVPLLPFGQLPPNYFQEQNDFERQIQSMTFTIDTTTPQGNQALTNTATGIKVKAFESNSVVNMIRENYESGLVMLAYKFLQASFDNLEENIVIKKMGDKGFREINKEAMRDAVRRYEIRVEAGSTSFDTTEQRRSDAIAQWNISLQAAQAGVPVDMVEQYKRLMDTFEGVDPEKLVKPPMPQIPGLEQSQGVGGSPIPMPKEAQNPANIPI